MYIRTAVLLILIALSVVGCSGKVVKEPISNIDHDRAFLEVVPDIRYQRPITDYYWNWHDTLIRPYCGFTAVNYKYSLLLWRLGRIKMEEVYLQQSSSASYLREWGL